MSLYIAKRSFMPVTINNIMKVNIYNCSQVDSVVVFFFMQREHNCNKL